MQENPYINQTQNPYINQQNGTNTDNSPLGTFTKESKAFDTQKFLIGAAVGALGAYLLTNENAQKNIFKAFAKGSEFMGGAIEEMKERYEDSQAEMKAEQNG